MNRRNISLAIPHSELGTKMCKADERVGFTLIELLVVVAVISLLASLIFPNLATAKSKAQGIACMNNLKNMTLSWTLHYDDHSGTLARNDPTIDDERWTGGSLLSYSWPRIADNWDHDRFTKKSPLWPYSGKSAGVWRCPGDRSYGLNARGERVPRIRSFSMNMFLGVEPDFTHFKANGFRHYRKEADLVVPGASKIFVFTDERFDSISDGSFFISMAGYRDQKGLTEWANLPGRYHNDAGSFSFADGHVETRRWTNPMTLPPYRTKGFRWIEPAPDNEDIRWLHEHASRKRNEFE